MTSGYWVRPQALQDATAEIGHSCCTWSPLGWTTICGRPSCLIRYLRPDEDPESGLQRCVQVGVAEVVPDEQQGLSGCRSEGVGVCVAAFQDAILVYDIAAAEATAQVLVAAESAGRPMSLADAQIAGICVTGATSWRRATCSTSRQSPI